MTGHGFQSTISGFSTCATEVNIVVIFSNVPATAVHDRPKYPFVQS